MSIFSNPFDSNRPLVSHCSCGRHASEAEHVADGEALANNVVEQAVMRALFPRDEMRRRFLASVGAGTALSADRKSTRLNSSH